MTNTAEKTYRIVNGTSYDDRTPMEVVKILESARQKNTKIHLSYGDAETGKDWMEENDVIGYVGRSTGRIQIPLLLKSLRSSGGGGILDRCIVRIIQGGKVVYSHPQYHTGKIVVKMKPEPIDVEYLGRLTVDVFRDGSLHASFRTMEDAMKWAKKYRWEVSCE